MAILTGHTEDGINRIGIVGDLDMFVSSIIKEQLWDQARVPPEYTDVEIDLAEMGYIDSSGVGILISFITMLRNSNKKVEVLNVRERVQNVFHLAGLENFIFGKKL